MFLLLAGGAFAGELQVIGIDGAADGSFCTGQDLSRQFDSVQIQNFAAGCADKVCVRCGDKVITLQTVNHTDGLNGTFFLEHGDVPVDCSQTQIRNFRLQLLVDPFCTGVALGSTDAVKDSIALSTVFSCSLHSVPPNR